MVKRYGIVKPSNDQMDLRLWLPYVMSICTNPIVFLNDKSSRMTKHKEYLCEGKQDRIEHSKAYEGLTNNLIAAANISNESILCQPPHEYLPPISHSHSLYQ